MRIEEGLVRIEIECQLSNYNGGGGLTGGGSYSPPYPCSDRRRQVEWTSVAPDFAAKIVADAERRATKRRDREAADEAAKPAAAKPVKLADPEWAKDAKTGGDE